jgi:hypothetical protein
MNPADRKQSVRDIALQIKLAQQQAFANLPPNQLYIVLYIRKDPPVENDFHWAFYYHKDSIGKKYHAKNLGAGWITDHGETNGLFKSWLLCVVITIASIPEHKEQQLDRIMRTYDSSINSILGISCRVWIFEILKILVQQNLVRCNDLQALEVECKSFGNQHMHTAAANEQPRPTVVSKLST